MGARQEAEPFELGFEEGPSGEKLQRGSRQEEDELVWLLSVAKEPSRTRTGSSLCGQRG